MNLKVDFAAGGIVLENNNILLVKNRKNEYVDKILTKIEYQIYSCYSNEFHKNTLFARPF